MTLRRDTKRWLDENESTFGEIIARLCGAWDEEVVDRPPSPYEVCKTMGLSYGALLKWVAEDEAREAQWSRVMKMRSDLYADEMILIADTPQVGVETKTKADGSVEKTESDMLGHRKLQIETRMRLIQKWHREKYGEKVEHNVSGGVTVQIMRFATGQLEEKVVEALPLEQAALPASATPSQAGEL